jgi:threonine efflux protein
MTTMSSVLQLLPLAVAWFLALLSPGPDFVVTVRYATARSRRDGALVGLGVTSAIAVWASMSMFGLVTLLSRVSWLYDGIRFAGALYLAFLGVQALRSARRSPGRGDVVSAAESAEGSATGSAENSATGSVAGSVVSSVASSSEHVEPASEERSAWRVWRVGFLTNIGNPKAAVFFGSLFGALLPPHPTVVFQGAVLVGMLGMAACWFTAVASLFSLPVVARGYQRAKRIVDAVTGCVFVALAGRLATE